MSAFPSRLIRLQVLGSHREISERFLPDGGSFLDGEVAQDALHGFTHRSHEKDVRVEVRPGAFDATDRRAYL